MAADPSPAVRPIERAGRISTQQDARFPGLTSALRARLAAIAIWGNLVCQIGIIVTGGAVRLTGSGLGCSTWPNCEPGEFAPQFSPEMTIHPFIEFGNRTLTGVLSVFAIAVLLISWRWLRHKGTGFRVLSVVPLIGTAVQGAIGAIVVFAHLHPGVVSPHFLISPLIVAVSTVLLVRLYEGEGPRRRAVSGGALKVFAPLAVVGFVVLVLGTIVTGTGPHSGDASEITRIPMDPRLASMFHAGSVYLFCGLLIAQLVVLHRSRARRETLRAGWALAALTALQGVIGYVQYFTGLPELLVGIHLLGAGLFAAGIAWLGTRMFTWYPGPADHERAPRAQVPREATS